VTAEKIVAYRQQHGAFRSVDELRTQSHVRGHDAIAEHAAS
jgi:DNA uptake protein ComE-like DNA-binding protein